VPWYRCGRLLDRERNPKPRANLVLYAGVLAPNAKLRPDVVALAAGPTERTSRAQCKVTASARYGPR